VATEDFSKKMKKVTIRLISYFSVIIRAEFSFSQQKKGNLMLKSMVQPCTSQRYALFWTERAVIVTNVPSAKPHTLHSNGLDSIDYLGHDMLAQKGHRKRWGAALKTGIRNVSGCPGSLMFSSISQAQIFHVHHTIG